MPVPYRLGIDIGTNSLGWCVLDLDRQGRPKSIRRIGVRIFSDGRDPQSGTSLAVERRDARGARRRRDRFVDRRADLMKALVRHGLMPDDPKDRKALEALDPYELRARGLDEKLHPHHLGRAIFHLNQRRGFKSNRKTDRKQKDNELKGMKGGIGRLREAIEAAGARTLGEYLYVEFRKDRTVRGFIAPDPNSKIKRKSKKRRQSHALERNREKRLTAQQTVRARPYVEKNRNEYDRYADREMYGKEFDTLWRRQVEKGATLCDKARDEIRDVIFYQRPLRPVDPGPCTFESDDTRAPLALPIVQDFRILQELANLEISDRYGQNARRLTREERDKLYGTLKRKDKLPFAGKNGVRGVLGLPCDTQINLEDERRKELKGDRVSAALSRKNCFGERWFELSEAQQTTIVHCLVDEPETASVVGTAQTEWGLTPEAAERVAKIDPPDGYGRIGLIALRKIVPKLHDGIGSDGGLMRYDEAVVAADPRYHHSDFRSGEPLLGELPYYGEILRRYMMPVRSPTAAECEKKYGRIGNPTVHVGLNQLKKLVNALVDRYGPPHEIVVELARDLKLNHEQKERLKNEQRDNKKKNDLRRQKLKDLGFEGRSDGLLRLRLWEELNPDNVVDRRCVYTNQIISCRQLFSDEVEIDHILPFSESLDDSPANLIVCFRDANRLKKKQTPYKAFASTPPPGTTWDDILLRIAKLPKNKQWRFRPDAMELVRSKALRAIERERGALSKEAIAEIERVGGFLARQLVDTAYLARVSRQYLWSVCDPNRVRVVPGRLTAFLRRTWGLNSILYGNRPDPDEHNDGNATALKRRDDHRHHAIDAFVVGCTDVAMLTEVSTAAGLGLEHKKKNMPRPWPGFHRDELKSRIGSLVVSVRPDHGISRSDNLRAKPPNVTSARLHEETAYGIVTPENRRPEDGDATLIFRKSIDALNAREVGLIRDPTLRDEAIRYVSDLLFDDTKLAHAKDGLKEVRRTRDVAAIERAKELVENLKRERKETNKKAAKELKGRLEKFGRERNLRRVRLLRTETSFIPVPTRSDAPYKAYSAGDNHRVELFVTPDGTWHAELVTMFDAHQPGYVPRWRIEAKGRHITTFHKNDYVKLAVNGQEPIMRVVSIWEKYLQLAEHYETNLAERYREGEFKWTFANYEKLRELNARKVTVDYLGRVHDPGPPK
jgi:CRISPR-associated endonuclease Csn1